MRILAAAAIVQLRGKTIIDSAGITMMVDHKEEIGIRVALLLSLF